MTYLPPFASRFRGYHAEQGLAAIWLVAWVERWDLAFVRPAKVGKRNSLSCVVNDTRLGKDCKIVMVNSSGLRISVCAGAREVASSSCM